MGADEKPKGNIVAKILGAVLVIIAVGCGVLGVIDLISSDINVLGSVVPEGLRDSFAFIELGAAVLFLIISIVVFKFSNNSKQVEEDELSTFENNVFNIKENKQVDKSNKYEQPSIEFPEEIPDEFKKFIKPKDDSERYLSKEDIGKDKAARPAYIPKSDDEYINQMSDDFDGITPKMVKLSDMNEAVTASKIIEFEEFDDEIEEQVEVEVEKDNSSKEIEIVTKKGNATFEKTETVSKKANIPSEKTPVENKLNSIDLSTIEKAVAEAVAYKPETHYTVDSDDSNLETSNSNANANEQAVNINSIDFSALETAVDANATYKYDEQDSNANNGAEVDNSAFRDNNHANSYGHQETESVSYENMTIDTEVFDVSIYEDSNEPKAPKVYDFAKKAAELAASKAADEEGKATSHTSSYLNSYLESFSSKPSSDTLYSTNADTINSNNYNPVFDDDDNSVSTDTSVEEPVEQSVLADTNISNQKSNFDSLLDSFTFSKK